MKASEVLKRYATGERDFRHIDLRGQSFKEEVLSDADFSGANIRGTNFSHAILKNANFVGSQAGLQKQWVVIQLLAALAVSALTGVLQGYTGYVLAYYLPNLWEGQWRYVLLSLTVIVAYFATLVTTFSAIARQGFTNKAFGSIVIAGTGVVAVAIAAVVSGAGAVSGTVTVAIAGIVAVTVAIAVAVTSSISGAISSAISGAITVTVAAIVARTFAVGGITVNSDEAHNFVVVVAVTVTISISVASLLFGIYCNRRMLDEKFALIRTFGVAFGAIGGTRFDNANLTAANFAHATLKSTNFRKANLTHVCWNNAHKLERARVGNSILSSPTVRDLLVTCNGYRKSYIDANLQGANLNEANLNEANLTRANLSGATMHHAQFKNANLREAVALGADFTKSYLTGACLEAWNINHTTNFKQIDCQYVFLLEQPNELGSRDRRPHEPDQVFKPGDFEKLYKKMMDVVQVLLRNGMNRTAFAEAFQKLIDEHFDISYKSIQAVERKGNDVLVTLEVPESANKAKISQIFRESYEDKVRQLEAKVEKLHKLRAADLKEVALRQEAQIYQFVVGKVMQESIDQSQTFRMGGDFSIHAKNSVVNLRDLSGTVSNTINQLPDSPNSDISTLKNLLTKLQQAIETDTSLDNADKADLLEQVQNLAKAKQTEEPVKREGLARKAKKMFEATLHNLPETAKITEACSKLLPLILKALGMPM